MKLKFTALELIWAYNKQKFKENNGNMMLQTTRKEINMFFIINC